MKNLLVLLLFCSMLQAQKVPFEYGYSAFGFSFARSTQDVPMKSITFTRHTTANYRVEATLNYVDEKDNTGGSGINSAGLDFYRMLFEEEDHLPLCGYSRLGAGFIKYSDYYYNFKIGFGLFHNFSFRDVALVPEFSVHYTLLMNANGDLNLGAHQFLEADNVFFMALHLNGIIKIMDKAALILSPAIQASQHEYAYRIKAGFSFNL
jgi:hypothetical protein